MRKLISFMHVSLDGFAAGPNGEMDWINVGDELFDYVEKRIMETDTAMYGRVTYELMESYWPTATDQPSPSRHDINHSKWYMQVAKIVLSKTMAGQAIPNTTIISENIAAEVAAIKQQAGTEILIFGSPRATHSLVSEDLVDEFWIFVNPVLIGEGIPLFENIKNKTSLKLITTKVFDSGVVCIGYEKMR